MAIIQNLEAFVQSYPAGLDSVTDLQLSQNENGRQIRFTIGGVTIPAGSVATISGTKPDGVVYSNTGTIEGADTVIFDEDVQMTAVFGTWYAKIRITNAGNTIASARVRFIIDKDPVDAGAIPSESQLDGLVAEAEEYAEAAEDAAGRAAITYGSPLTASTAAAMTDVNRVYVYTGSESGYTYGNWYYYNGSAWVSGGIYNSAAVETDTTLTESGVPADAKATGDKIDELKDDLTYYEHDNDNRFIFSDNLIDQNAVSANSYISNTNGQLVPYNGWFATAYTPIVDSETYSFIIKQPNENWKIPSGVYYAFYDSNRIFTHGGVSVADTDISPQSGDAYFRGSYYSGLVNGSMFGTSTDMSHYINTVSDLSPYYVAPKYSADVYNGLLGTFVAITDPYYERRITGNRITTSENGTPTGAYIKFSSISITGKNGTKTKTWADFKTDTQNDLYVEIGASNDFTPDTFRVIPEYGIVYDYSSNAYHMRAKSYIQSLSQNEMVIFYVDADSVPSGVLYDSWANNHKQGIEKYIRTIEDKETELLNYSDNFVFAFATDCHWYFDDTTYHNYTNEMIEELRHCIGFDCYINGGDSIYYGTKFKLNSVASMNQAFSVEHDNLIYCIGNHDYNGISTGETQNSSWMLDDNAIESLCFRKMQNIVRPDGKKYYYRDFEDKKIRVIVLDSQDVGTITFDANGALTSADPLTVGVVRQDQLDWLCNVLNCPSADWGVIAVMHIGIYDDADGFPANTPPNNSQALIEIFKKYVLKSAYSYSTSGTYAASGNGTFETANGHLIGVWSGHAHADGYCNSDGFNAIQTECGYPDSSDRVVGTINEICVDCVCVDKTNKTVTLKRFGSGADRSYTFI